MYHMFVFLPFFSWVAAETEMVGPEVRKYSGHPPWGSQGELQTCRAFIALLEQKRPDINQRVNVFAEFLEGPALDWFLQLDRDLIQDWTFLQSELESKFRVASLSIVQKFHIRQSLMKQYPQECVQDFLERYNHFGYGNVF